MKGFSPRNLKYMRSFAQVWPDAEFVQGVLAQLPWYHQLTLLDKLRNEPLRRWYVAKAIEHNWSRNVLLMQIETRLHERSGQAVTNFAERLPGNIEGRESTGANANAIRFIRGGPEEPGNGGDSAGTIPTSCVVD